MIEKLSKRKITVLIILLYVALYVGFKLIIVYYQDLYMSNDIYEIKYSDAKTINIKLYTNDQVSETDYFDGFEAGILILIMNIICYMMRMKKYRLPL